MWVALGVCAVLALGGFWWWRAEQSPRASIGRVAKAAMNRDIEAVEAAVDTTAIISSAVDDMYNDPHFSASYVASYTAKHPGVNAGGHQGPARRAGHRGSARARRGRDAAEAHPDPGDSIKGLVALAYARHSVKSMTMKGNYAYATVSVPYHGKNYNVVVRLRRSGNDWVVDRIENLPRCSSRRATRPRRR